VVELEAALADAQRTLRESQVELEVARAGLRSAQADGAALREALQKAEQQRVVRDVAIQPRGVSGAFFVRSRSMAALLWLVGNFMPAWVLSSMCNAPKQPCAWQVGVSPRHAGVCRMTCVLTCMSTCR
jgi:hypothetical protein